MNRGIASDVFNILNNLNPKFVKEMFERKDLSYFLRDSNILFQNKFRNLTCLSPTHIYKLWTIYE